MKVLFLEIDTVRDWAVASLGPAFIGALLRKHGHVVEMIRVNVDMSLEELISGIKQQAPDILGVSLTSRQWLRAKEIVRQVRQEVDVPVIAGGLHPTFAPEEVVETEGFDFVCLGEGEMPMLDLVTALEKGESTTNIKNIWFKGGHRPLLRAPFEPLDGLPYMARDMLDEFEGCVHMTTQRGCPFPCTYCAARKFEDLYEGVGSYGRRRTVRSVLDELFAIREEGTLNYIIFLDDTFTINHPWVKEFCAVFEEELNLPFSLHARVETVNEKMLHMLAEAGCRHITYGVESGSRRIRWDIMKRPVENQRFKDVFRWTKEAGILVTANYMLGVPEETRDDMQQTLDLAEELAADDFGYFVFYPYPGTSLFRYCQEKGYLPENFLEQPANHRESILTLPTLTAEDISEYYERFTQLREALYETRRKSVLGTDELSTEERVNAVAHVRRIAETG